MKYPISVKDGKLSERFLEVLKLHVPPSKDKVILDPTCGKRYLWQGIPYEKLYGKVIFFDIRDYGQGMIQDLFTYKPKIKFDAIIYDPPYLFGYKGSKDPRRKDYGDYCQSYNDLLKFMTFANSEFPKWLKEDGKLIVKCSDQFHVKERKFYPLHITWVNTLSNFELIDIMIYQHHRISPTAFQVKNRPCSVIMHTYFLIFKLR